MTRKLQHTMFALSATAAVFTALLLAGAPVQPASPPLVMVSAEAGDSEAGVSMDGLAVLADAAQASSSQRRHQRHSRALLALPYFSFAQGLRRNRS